MECSMKNAYIFTLTFLIYRFSFYIVSLLLPWKEGKDFFELILEKNESTLIFIFEIIGLFIFLIIFALVSFINERIMFFEKSNFLKKIFSLNVIWLLIFFENSIIMTSFALSNAFIIGVPDGIGSIIINFSYFGFIELIAITDPLWIFILILFNGFTIYFPFLIFCFGFPRQKKEVVFKTNSKISIKESQPTKILKKSLQKVGWICCIILTSGIFISLLISLFLPWSIYNNFLIFLISQFNGKTAGLFISIIISIILLIFILVSFIITFFIVKPRVITDKNEESRLITSSKNGIFKITLSRWFIYLICLWIFLSISITYGLTLINVGDIAINSGFLIYISTAHLTSIISIIIGMIIVFYYVNQNSKEIMAANKNTQNK